MGAKWKVEQPCFALRAKKKALWPHGHSRGQTSCKPIRQVHPDHTRCNLGPGLRTVPNFIAQSKAANRQPRTTTRTTRTTNE
jgi:hypothetical protein